MAQNITLMGAAYADVPAITVPKTGGGTARFDDASVTTAVESDVAEGKLFLLADGSIGTGTNEGGGGGVQRTTVVPEQTITVTQENTLLSATGQIAVGDVCAVTVNGTEVINTAIAFNANNWYVGGVDYLWGGTGYAIDVSSYGEVYFDTYVNGTYTVKVEVLSGIS